MIENVNEAKELLNKLNRVSEDEVVERKIRMVLIRQFLEDTRKQIRTKEKISVV